MPEVCDVYIMKRIWYSMVDYFPNGVLRREYVIYTEIGVSRLVLVYLSTNDISDIYSFHNFGGFLQSSAVEFSDRDSRLEETRLGDV